MTSVYISGPMRGIQDFNFGAFIDAEYDIEHSVPYVKVFSPARRDLNNGFDPWGYDGNEDLSLLGFDLREALEIDMAYITSTADAIVVLPGWEASSGAMAEVTTGRALGLPVYELDDFITNGLFATGIDVVSDLMDHHAGLELDDVPDSRWQRLKDALWPQPTVGWDWPEDDIFDDFGPEDDFNEVFADHGPACEWCHPELHHAEDFAAWQLEINSSEPVDAIGDGNSVLITRVIDPSARIIHSAKDLDELKDDVEQGNTAEAVAADAHRERTTVDISDLIQGVDIQGTITQVGPATWDESWVMHPKVDPALDAGMDPRCDPEYWSTGELASEPEPDVYKLGAVIPVSREWAVDRGLLAEETRVVNPETGGEKGTKLARFDLIPADVVTQLAEHYGRGAAKYEDRNWERGYDWSLSFAALCRHLFAFWGGEDIDPETGSPHIIAVAWHAFALAEFADTHPELDDRPCAVTSFEDDDSEWRAYL